jgi:hypothetical protein
VGSDMVVAEYGPLRGRFYTLWVPQWVTNPTVLPGQDRIDMLEIRSSRRFRMEQWMIAPVEGKAEVLAAFRLLGGGKRLGDPADVRFEVYVPLAIYVDFDVKPFRA